MTKQFGHPGFLVPIGVAAVCGLIFVLATRHFNKKEKSRKLSVEYFRNATGTSLTVVGLLAPILVALLSYLYLKVPSGDYSALLATVVLLYVVITLAIWSTFAILRKAQGESVVTLTLPKDLKYITAMGLMYCFQLLGLVTFAVFFLGFLPKAGVADEPAPAVGGRILLRPIVSLGVSRSEVVRLWGVPSPAGDRRSLEYSTGASRIVVAFDENDRVSGITERPESKEAK